MTVLVNDLFRLGRPFHCGYVYVLNTAILSKDNSELPVFESHFLEMQPGVGCLPSPCYALLWKLGHVRAWLFAVCSSSACPSLVSLVHVVWWLRVLCCPVAPSCHLLVQCLCICQPPNKWIDICSIKFPCLCGLPALHGMTYLHPGNKYAGDLLMWSVDN